MGFRAVVRPSKAAVEQALPATEAARELGVLTRPRALAAEPEEESGLERGAEAGLSMARPSRRLQEELDTLLALTGPSQRVAGVKRASGLRKCGQPG